MLFLVWQLAVSLWILAVAGVSRITNKQKRIGSEPLALVQRLLPYLVGLTCLLACNLQAQMLSHGLQRQDALSASTMSNSDAIVLPRPLRDPLEPFNRAVWNFNRGLMSWVIKPFSRGYRFVVPKPVRIAIGNCGRNLTFPGRLINGLLQGNWKLAKTETARCLCNTIFGLGGFFDVATHWKIPKRNADFGQTFRKWGCKPGVFLMLPVFGPSDARDTTGLIADFAANPLTYFSPYCYIGSGVKANNLSDSVDESVRLIKVEPDSYSILHYAWTFGHENHPVDLRMTGTQDPATLETLKSFLFRCNNPAFPERGTTRSVLIPTTRKKLDFTFWLEPERAPLVYLNPGFGAHRLAGSELALAELLVENGYSAVCVSSTFHPEFMEHAATTDLPDYPPNGVADLHVALTAIDHQLERTYPHRFGARAVMGYSMGAFQSLLLAATEADATKHLIEFRRYVAIDTPVRLRYAVSNLDAFYNAPLAWPAAERTAKIENTLQKVVTLLSKPPAQKANLPFNAIESKFLVGLSFRLALRDMIFDSQLRHNQGILHVPIKRSRRRMAYNEILNYSFRNYIDLFATPYDKARGIDLTDPKVVKHGTDLTDYTDGLKANPAIRVILNRNDFLLSTQDIAWAKATFAPSRLTLFPNGGHLGNLSQPAVLQAILATLDGLGPSHMKSPRRIARSIEMVGKYSQTALANAGGIQNNREPGNSSVPFGYSR